MGEPEVSLREITADTVREICRLLVDAGHQGKGYGRRTVELVCDHVRTRPGGTELLTSWVPGGDGPEGFYLKLGFQLTGEVDEDEVVARLPLSGPSG
jgi:diamine N-acetyltransferase